MIGFSLGFIVCGLIYGYYTYQQQNTQHNTISQTNNIGGCITPSNRSNRSHTISGNSISIGSKLIVDGVVISDGIGQCMVNVTVEGDCHDLTTTNGDVDVMGDVTNNVKTTNGDIEVHKSVGGSVTTSNSDVNCGAISGNVSTQMGDINHK